MRPLKQNVRQKYDPFVIKSTPEQLPSLQGHPSSGCTKNTSFVILDEFSRVSGDLLDPTPSGEGQGRGKPLPHTGFSTPT